MSKIRIAQIGCGGMGKRHIMGQIELKKQGFDTFDLIALCDNNLSTANHLAKICEKELNTTPKIYDNFNDLLKIEKPDAIDIVTDTKSHHSIAINAFSHGAHVAVEKPLSLTVKSGILMIETAKKHNKILSVSENYRRDPLNRLAKFIIEKNILGNPRIAIFTSATGTKYVPHTTAWRHLKLRGGYLLDYEVHTADLLLYFLGSIKETYATTILWEPKRINNKEPNIHLSDFYSHRIQEEIDKKSMIDCDSEDFACAIFKFENKATGQFLSTIASPGLNEKISKISLEKGAIFPSPSRSGKEIQINTEENIKLNNEQISEMTKDFDLDAVTKKVFNTSKRITGYDLPFKIVDRKLIALELQDFGTAISNNSQPEVTGEIGLEALSLIYSILESGHIGEPVNFNDVYNDRIKKYQKPINDSIGL